jgi:hypothetical protein
MTTLLPPIAPLEGDGVTPAPADPQAQQAQQGKVGQAALR